MEERWRITEKINQQLTGTTTAAPKYVLLLYHTRQFHLEQDLKQCLGIKSQNNVWFISEFLKHGVAVEYFTVFTSKERKKFGPIASKISEDINVYRLTKKYVAFAKNITLICPMYYKNRFKHVFNNIITVEEFMENVLCKSLS